MYRRLLFLFLVKLPTFVWTTQCIPCCSLGARNLSFSRNGRLLGVETSGGSKNKICAIGVYDFHRIHKVLSGKWLYFAGDSSTRGLVLAIYYELLNARSLLKGLTSWARGSDDLSTRLERCRRIFHYGDLPSRARCKTSFETLGRLNGAASCDDMGNPCDDKLPELSPETKVSKSPSNESAAYCKKSRRSTHSIASLHLGFLDSGFCDGHLEFITVLPHDYLEGGFDAPPGAMDFETSEEEREFTRKFESTAGREGKSGCTRLTFRMIPRIGVFANDLAAAFSTTNRSASMSCPIVETRPSSMHTHRNESRKGKALFQKPPSMIWLQAGAWDRAGFFACTRRDSFASRLLAASRLLRLCFSLKDINFVLGTLPSGAAFPATELEIQAEMARLRLIEGKKVALRALKRVHDCLDMRPLRLKHAESGQLSSSISKAAFLISSNCSKSGSVSSFYWPAIASLKHNCDLLLNNATPEEMVIAVLRHNDKEFMQRMDYEKQNSNDLKDEKLIHNFQAQATDNAKIEVFNRRESWEALYNSQKWKATHQFKKGVPDMVRLHVSMLQNVIDSNRLLSALFSSPSNSENKEIRGQPCGCGRVRMVIHNPGVCAPTKAFVTPSQSHGRDAFWPPGYPFRGRLPIWAEPCSFSAQRTADVL